MFQHPRRPEFSNTLVLDAAAANAPDPMQQMERADRADWALLRLVCCSALATFVLALASSLQP